MTPITLTDEQELALAAIVAWQSDTFGKNEFRLGGYAGTGKTTILKTLLDRLATKIPIAVAAFTGKAVHVLQKKGLRQAQTLHSLMYNVETLKGGACNFTLKTRLDPEPNLIIVDEASMISTELYDDLCSFNIKLLFVGDPGQLEPVGDNPNLMKDCDFTLSKIHRQAEDSPIIVFATRIRLGNLLIPRPSDSATTTTSSVTVQPK